MREGESVERVGRLGQRMNGLMGNRPDIQGRYSTADALWDSTGGGHRGKEGEDTHIIVSVLYACSGGTCHYNLVPSIL